MSKDLTKGKLPSMTDCKSIEEFSIGKFEMIRGATPEDINEKCLKLCQDYLAGIWLKQTVDTIKVKRLTGGQTNQLYYCAITDINKENVVSDGVPHEVAIRLYGTKHFKKEDGSNPRLSDLILALMLSQNKLGPKIYGLFQEGEIQHYYKHRHFMLEEQNNPQLVNKLFRNLARVHAMDVPIKKTSNYWFEYFDKKYEKAYENFPINQMINDMNLVTLKKYDLKKEIDWLKQTIIKINSQVVFGHYDFFGENIMVTEPNDEIIICDFEYSHYTYRGFDFASLLLQWGLKVDELYKGINQLKKYPDDDKIRSLLRPYFEESVRIFGKKYSENKINSLDQLVRESKLFSMVKDIFLVLFFLKNKNDIEDGIPMDKKLMMELAESNFKGYWELKTKFIQDKIFD